MSVFLKFFLLIVKGMTARITLRAPLTIYKVMELIGIAVSRIIMVLMITSIGIG